MLRWRAWTTDETGSASLEFITIGLILLVPLVYLVVALAVIQGGALAIEGAARQAARVYVQSGSVAEGREAVQRAVDVALDDFGIGSAEAVVQVSCDDETNGCLESGTAVTVNVSLRIGLPLVPDVLSLRDAVSVPLEASATQLVSRLRGSGA